MEPRKLFMMTVQTMLLHDRTGAMGPYYFVEAAKVPEEAYANAPGGAAEAAFQWWSWRQNISFPKPEWLEAHEEARRNQVTVRRKEWPDQEARVHIWRVLLVAARSERDLRFPLEIALVVEDVRDAAGQQHSAVVTRAEGERFHHWAMAQCRELGCECPFEFEADPPLGAQP
jgi:hypothetical protein